jgi:F-type H+-transporting ATPase subunit epsilon
MNTFEITVVAPTGELFASQEVKKVIARTRAGEITILAKHTPIVSVLKIGQLIIHTSDQERRLAVFGGFIEVRESGEVIILADEAQRPADIDLAEAKAAKKKTQKIISEKNKESRAKDHEAGKLTTKLKKTTTQVAVGGWQQSQR